MLWTLSWLIGLILSVIQMVQTPADTSLWHDPLVYQDTEVSQPVDAPRLVSSQETVVQAAEAPREAFTEAQMRDILSEAGWPSGPLTEEALSISFCESKWRWWVAGDSGNSVSLFQLGKSRPGWQGWFNYFGVDESLAFDPVTNARVALMVRTYLGRWGGSGGWSCAALSGIY